MELPFLAICRGNESNIVSMDYLEDLNRIRENHVYTFDELVDLATDWIESNLEIDAINDFLAENIKNEDDFTIIWNWPKSIDNKQFDGTFFRFCKMALPF